MTQILCMRNYSKMGKYNLGIAKINVVSVFAGVGVMKMDEMMRSL